MSYGAYRLSDWNHRPPLVAEVSSIDGERSFLIVNVHLARGNARLRTEQATGLREWARSQTLPVILAGDCNFDFQFDTGRGNAAWKAFFADGVWNELEPEKRIDTNWADDDGDGADNYPNSSLDFVALRSSDPGLIGVSRVFVRPGDFPDDATTSDHRAVYGIVMWR
jgi:endonuclease/exonuclease/phosphatase family metal-dependent hydrolase